MPTKIDVDKNLLFAVIALQDDLIDQTQFADVCAGWAVRLDRPLSEMLIERGWIQILAHQVLDLLVNSRAQRESVLAGDFDTLDDVAGIDVDYRGDLRGLALYQGRRAGQKHPRQKQSHGADKRQSDAHSKYADEIE